MMDMSMNDRLRKIRHVVMDMDGTIYLGNQIFPFTLPFLKGLEEKGIGYSFLTNNPTNKRHFPQAQRIYVLGTESLQRLFRQSGYTLVGEEENLAPDVLVVSFDMTLTYRRLCKAAWWARQEVPYLATNPDWVCPTEEETVLVDCGSIQACIEAATGRKADRVLGKPDPTMLLELEDRLGLEKDEVAMVGDRAYTDVEMARRAGALPVLVLSGETTREMLPEVSRPGDLVVADLEEFGKLLLSHE